tara:strand:- start:1343 stop:1594 length:252 start_codon:yes stop_codon:yes gene_type:complete
MKYLITVIVIASITSIIYGFTLDESQATLANKYKGFGTVGLFLVAMPLFLYTAGKGKNMKDYMLTEENIKKMRRKEREKPDSQ